jgi:hypothetical protein
MREMHGIGCLCFGVLILAGCFGQQSSGNAEKQGSAIIMPSQTARSVVVP